MLTNDSLKSNPNLSIPLEVIVDDKVILYYIFIKYIKNILMLL